MKKDDLYVTDTYAKKDQAWAWYRQMKKDLESRGYRVIRNKSGVAYNGQDYDAWISYE